MIKQQNKRSKSHGFSKALCCAGWLAAAALSISPAEAVVDDAHSFALEAAQSYVEEQGVRIRYDYASGRLENEESSRVGYQVFRGNRYWFFLGSSEEGTALEMEVTDVDGNVIEGELKKVGEALVFEFKPERTMLVAVRISGVVKDMEGFNWALVYGYKTGGVVKKDE
ncbi:hypothetical protein [Sulfuriroseicoccus oceanibius]|uniref:Uncharacterized protein n=1 Tax=Sulfuriroseicoccus oceanibius TaxID=2707525 RepID=A0A6B3L4S3_9BACT|nr:hypothetical protein [Sulfuriroseicoccus oceanibius]QQL44708.1 hypothetical protein G3M56_012595 [Sulfuriroseicoccus oceanibius]